MSGRAAEATAVSALALAIIVVVAAPVLRAPAERLFGREIVHAGGLRVIPIPGASSVTVPGGCAISTRSISGYVGESKRIAP